MSAATLQGTVLADYGRPIPQIVVGVFKSSAAGPIKTFTSYSAVTDIAGRFTVSIPESGNFIICAGSPKDALLNSCDWPTIIPSVQIPAGNGTVTKTITLQTGITLYFRFNDPSGLLSRPNNSATGSVSVGVWDSRGIFFQAYPTSADSKGFNYELVVPASQSFRLSVRGAGVQVLDATGTLLGTALSPILAGSSISLQSLATEAAVPKVFTIAAQVK